MPKQTALHAIHAAAGATFTEFAGYDMPVHYGSIKEEHHAVRNAVGMFDVSHMSNLWISGPGAAATISAVCPFNAEALPDGKGKYTAILRADGTILDDTFVFRVGDKFHMVPNAGRNVDAADHLRAHAVGDVAVDDYSEGTAILAVQGPAARGIVAALMDVPMPKFHHIAHAHIAGVHVGVSSTGYTGEKGVEIYAPAEDAPTLWNAILAAGADGGIRPIGLGARDTLRLEKGYALAGNEFEGGRTPLEAGLEWIIDWNQEFLGKAALLAQKEAGHATLVGLVQEKGVPRHGYPVMRDGQTVGVVTSGSQSPTTGQGIALAICEGLQEGDGVAVQVRSREMAATVVRPPFA